MPCHFLNLGKIKNMREGKLKFRCPMFRKTFESQSISRARYQSSLLRRNILFRLTVMLLMAIMLLSNRVLAEGHKTYAINLPAQSVAQSLTDLSVQIDKQLLFPYKLAASIDANPVIGRYTLQQALGIMLEGTGFSGGLTTKGVLMISLKKSEVTDAETEGIEMNMKKNILAATVGFFMAGGVGAQEVVSQDDEMGWLLEEIVVTAQKREQRLIDVPISISAIDEDILKVSGVQGIGDLAYIVPGLAVSEGDAGTKLISIRGVGNIRGGSPLVGIYLDEVPLSINSLLTVDLQANDIERVEVLRGPQGTLYGQGAVGGTIRFISKKPSFDSFSADVGASIYNTKGGDISKEVRAAANIPVVSDTLAFRVGASYKDQGGWIDQPSRNIDDANDTELLDLNIKGLWHVSDDLTVDMMAIRYRNEAGSFNQTNIGKPSDTLYQPTFRQGQDFASTDIEYEYDIYNITVNYDLGFATLVSSSSQYDVENFQTSQSASLVLVPGIIPGDTLFNHSPDPRRTAEGFTQEIRLVGSSETLEWSVGGFYSDVDISTSDTGLERYISGGILLGVSDPFISASTSESIAIFADFSYAINDQLTLSVGSRYFEDERTETNINFGQDDEGEFDNVSSRIALSYAPTDQATFYASISEGFRSGGFNTISDVDYDPESLTTYELGVKSALLDGRLSAELAIFHSDYVDYQATSIDFDVSPIGFISNPGEAEIQGIDWVTLLRVTEQFSLGFSGNIMNTEFTTVDANDPTYNKGDPLFLIPDYSYSLTADYTFNWSSSVSGFAHMDYNRQGPSSWVNRGAGLLDEVAESTDIGFLNAQLGAQWNDVTVRLFGKNLTNELRPNAPSIVNTFTQSRPRTVGVDISYSF